MKDRCQIVDLHLPNLNARMPLFIIVGFHHFVSVRAIPNKVIIKLCLAVFWVSKGLFSMRQKKDFSMIN